MGSRRVHRHGRAQKDLFDYKKGDGFNSVAAKLDIYEG